MNTCAPLVVDAKGLAILLSKSVRTIRTWDAAGVIPAPVKMGGGKSWRVEEIREWLNAGSPDRDTWNARRAASRR